MNARTESDSARWAEALRGGDEMRRAAFVARNGCHADLFYGGSFHSFAREADMGCPMAFRGDDKPHPATPLT